MELATPYFRQPWRQHMILLPLLLLCWQPANAFMRSKVANIPKRPAGDCVNYGVRHHHIARSRVHVAPADGDDKAKDEKVVDATTVKPKTDKELAKDFMESSSDWGQMDMPFSGSFGVYEYTLISITSIMVLLYLVLGPGWLRKAFDSSPPRSSRNLILELNKPDYLIPGSDKPFDGL